MDVDRKHVDAQIVEELRRQSSRGRPWVFVASEGGAPRGRGRADLRGADLLAELPGIAIVGRACTGFELEVALAATLVVAEPGAKFGGHAPSPPLLPGTLHRLRARLGAGAALAFWLDSRAWSARRAHARGLIDAVDDEPEARAESWAKLWSESGGAAEKLMLLRRARAGLSERSALTLERALFALSFAEDKARSGARDFFE